MKTIALEVRDKHTMIPVLAIALEPNNTDAAYLLGRTGWNTRLPCVYLIRLSDMVGHADSRSWGDARTLGHAHAFIEKNITMLYDGDVVDVQFILGETKSPVRSTRMEEMQNDKRT